MKKLTSIVILTGITLIAMTSCNPDKNKRIEKLSKAGIHTVIVQEIIQTSNYTYLRLHELGNTEAKGSVQIHLISSLGFPKFGTL